MDGAKQKNTTEPAIASETGSTGNQALMAKNASGADTRGTQQSNTVSKLVGGGTALGATQPGNWTTRKDETIQRQEELPEDRTLLPTMLPAKIASADGENSIQNQSLNTSPSDASSLQSQLNSTKGSGAPLQPAIKDEMNGGIGADFSQVRVHTGNQAVQMNQQLNARAFTHGSDVYFNAGEFNPGSQGGKRLLAHELTHVVQQGAAQSDVQTKRQEESVSSIASDFIQRDAKKEKEKALPDRTIEIRDGNIVFSHPWFMRKAKRVENNNKVGYTNPQAFRVIIRELQKRGSLTWVTKEQIRKKAGHLWIVGKLDQIEEGNIKVSSYGIVTVIHQTFGIPKGDRFLSFPIGDYYEVLVRTSEIKIDDQQALSQLVNEIIDSIINDSKLSPIISKDTFRDQLKQLFSKNFKAKRHTNKFIIERSLLDDFFGADAWEKYQSNLKLGVPAITKKSPPAPAWLLQLKGQVKNLLALERAKDSLAADLPDRFYAYWSKSHWRGVGERGIPGQKKKARSGIRLKESATAQKVLQRIRLGLRSTVARQEKKVVHQSATNKQEIDSDYLWAEDIRRALMKRVVKDTKGWRNHRRLNVPDKLSLQLVDRPGSEKKDVNLIVTVVGRWRMENGEFETPRKSGVFPVALKPEMSSNLNKLYLQVNSFAFALRQDPEKNQKTPVDPELFEGRIDEAYPAYITIKNMRADFRTVTGGEHELFMALSYFGLGYRDGIESVAEAMRTTYTYWELFKLEDVLGVVQKLEDVQREGNNSGSQPSEKPIATAQATYDNVDEQYRKQRNKHQKRVTALLDAVNRDSTGKDIFKTLTPVWSSSEYDQELDYKMPSKEGDYVMYASTRFRPNEKRKTVGSRAAFVFRVLDGYKLAKQEAHKRPNRIESIKRQLGNADLSGKKRRELQQELSSLQESETAKYSLFDKFHDNEGHANTAIRLHKKLLRYFTSKKYPSNLAFITAIANDKDAKHPKDGAYLQALWTTFMEEFWVYGRQTKITGLKNKIKAIEKSKRQIRKFRKRLGRYTSMFRDFAEVETPETALVSEVTGKTYRLLMMVGEATDSVIDDDITYLVAKQKGLKVYVLADVTTKDSDRFVGYGATKEAAIQHAFEEFAKDNAYGEGYLHYRIPGGSEGKARNEPGFKRQVLNALAIVAAVAGIIALALGTVATGGALGAIAFAAGLTAGVSGGIVAAHNISERVENNRFSFDVEFAMDLVNIIGAFAAGAGAITKLGSISKLGSTATAVTRATNFLKLQKVLALHSIADFGTNAILLSIKVQKDIKAIEESDLPDKEKEAMKRQIINNAIQSGAMLMVSTKGMADDFKIGFLQRKSSGINHGDYEAMNNRTGITDKDGEFTFKINDENGVPISRKKIQAEEADATPTKAKSAEGEASSDQGTRPKSATKKNSRDPKDLVIKKYDPLPEATVMQPKDGKDVKSVEVMYNNLIKDSVGREAGIYRNSETGEYIVIQGDAGTVFVLGTSGAKEGPGPAGYAQEWKVLLNSRQDAGRWELQAHYHPAKSKSEGVVDANRMPSGGTGDFGVLVRESQAAGGGERVSKIDFFTADGPNFTIFSYRPNADQPFLVNYPNPKTKEREVLQFKTLEEYHQWMLKEHKISLGEVPADLKVAPRKKGEDGPEPSGKPGADKTTASGKTGDAGKVSVPQQPQPISAALQKRIGRLRTRLRRARLDKARIERLLNAGLQMDKPDKFFQAVQSLVKKRSKTRKKLLTGLLSTNQAEFAAAALLTQRLANGGTYGKRIRALLRVFTPEQIGRGVLYIQNKHSGLADGWIFRRLEKAAQAHKDGAEILIWSDLPIADKKSLPEGHREIERGAGEALIDQGIKGDIGEYLLTLEALRIKFGKSIPESKLRQMVDQMFRHEFSNQKRPKAERRALARFDKDGDIHQLIRSLPAAGAIEVSITLADGRVRRIDHLRSENGSPVFRENKNVKSLRAEPDSHIRAEIDKDIALLQRYPDSTVEWRLTDTDRKTAGLGDIADQSFLDYVRDTAKAAGVEGRFILIGDDSSTSALKIPAARSKAIDPASDGGGT